MTEDSLDVNNLYYNHAFSITFMFCGRSAFYGSSFVCLHLFAPLQSMSRVGHGFVGHGGLMLLW